MSFPYHQTFPTGSPPREGAVLLQDNARPYSSKAIQQKLLSHRHTRPPARRAANRPMGKRGSHRCYLTQLGGELYVSAMFIVYCLHIVLMELGYRLILPFGSYHLASPRKEISNQRVEPYSHTTIHRHEQNNFGNFGR